MEKLSIRIVDILLEKEYIEKTMYSVYQYGMQMALEMGCSFITSIVICALSGKISEGIIFFSIFIPLRSYLGGVHMKNYWSCFVCSCMTLIGVLLLVNFCETSPFISWAILTSSVTIIIAEARGEYNLDDTGKRFYPRICVIVVCILAVGIVFSIVANFSLLFLLACTNVIVALSKMLEVRKNENINEK